MRSSCLFGFLGLEEEVPGLPPLSPLYLASRSRRWRSLRLRSSSETIVRLLIEESELRLGRSRGPSFSGDAGSAKMSNSGPRGFPLRGRWWGSSCDRDG